MLIVFYVLLVWFKIVVGISVAFLWLWLIRDRGVTGVPAILNYVAVVLLWALPWAVFLWSQSDLYQGHCGLRQGIHDCDVAEFLWTRLRWVRLGFVLDVVLLAGVFLLIARARPSSEESRNFGPRGPHPAGF